MGVEAIEKGLCPDEFLSVSESLTTMESEEEAAAAFEVVTSLFDRRSDISFVEDGERYPGTMVTNGRVAVGDAGRSYTMASSADGVPITTDVVVARAGRVVVIVMYSGVGAADPGTTADLARLALRKVESQPSETAGSPSLEDARPTQDMTSGASRAR